MRSSLRAASRPVYRFARLLAVVGQLAFGLVPLAEGRHAKPNPAAHVEAQGIEQHVVHDESTCVTCIVLSMAARQETPVRAGLATVARPSLPLGFPPLAPPPSVRVHDNPSRAPPCVS